MSIKRLVLIFILALLLGGIVNVPAAFVLKKVEPSIPQTVSVQGVSGTVWSGRAQLINVRTAQGLHAVNDLKWRVNPLHLFLGRVKAHVTFGMLGGEAESDVSVSLGKTLTLNDFIYLGGVQPWVQHYSNGFADMTGQATLKIKSLDYALAPEPNQLTWPQNVEAQLVLSQTNVTRPMPMGLGNVSADVTQENNGKLVARLTGNGGELDISGQAHIQQDLNYATDIKLKPTNKLQDNMRSALGIALPQQSDGSFMVKQKGALRLR